jgi:hypothetical protein
MKAVCAWFDVAYPVRSLEHNVQDARKLPTADSGRSNCWLAAGFAPSAEIAGRDDDLSELVRSRHLGDRIGECLSTGTDPKTTYLPWSLSAGYSIPNSRELWGRVKKKGSIRITYAHFLTGRIPAAAERTARGVGCRGSTAR